MRVLRVLIADDEPLARDLLRSMLADRDDLTVVAEAGNGREAVLAIRRHHPDVVLLDIQMPEMDGLEVIDAIGATQMPAVIFVTAYDRYAVRAFEIEAVDYLLKPFDADRLEVALRRVRAGDVTAQLGDIVGRLRAGRGSAARLPVKVGGVVRFVSTDAVDWIEADGKHARLHVGREVHTVRETLGSVASRLNPEHFVRVHRSTVVNARRLREVQPWFQGDYVLILEDGTRLTSGRTYRDRVRRLIDEP